MTTITGARTYETAETIADAFDGDEEVQARVWEGDYCTRVYLSRELSRGRQQDMGYVEILEAEDDDGEVIGVTVESYITRRRSHIHRVIDSAIA